MHQKDTGNRTEKKMKNVEEFLPNWTASGARDAHQMVAQSTIVELPFFGGLSIAESAEVLSVSRRLISAEWEMARAWLFGRLKEAGLQ